MRILYASNPLNNNALRIDKVTWITAQNCGNPKPSFTSSLSWKGKILGLDIVSQNVP